MRRAIEHPATGQALNDKSNKQRELVFRASVNLQRALVH
jgi:hypothetical protein